MDHKALRRALAELWRLVQDGPQELRYAYRDLEEARLLPAANVAADELVLGKLIWTWTTDWTALAISIGGQLRALDAEMSRRPQFRAAPSSPRSLLCGHAGVFVVPRGHPRATDRRPGPGNGFGRRATPNHRVIPRFVGDRKEVQLRWRAQLAPGAIAGGEQRLGAALFPGLAVKWGSADGVHVANDVDCPDEAAAIAAQVSGAFDDRLLAAAWPELTMHPRLLARLKKELRGRADDTYALTGPTIVVAGSWHETKRGVIRNVMRVLDKSGVERLRFDKVSAYVGSEGREGNAPGTTIPILINQDMLVTFAICSDFCDLEEPGPYLDLDVDLLVVVSLGNGSALKGHEGNAERLSVTFGTTTLVVQQNIDAGKPSGWVIPPKNSGGLLIEDEAWSMRRAYFNRR